jgi:hypothetical protein
VERTTVTADAAGARRKLFSAVSAVTWREPGRFDAEVDPAWTTAGKPNGGYLLAMLGRASTYLSEHDHAIAASAHYLRSPEPGPVVIVTETLRAGRSASQLRARLEQDGRACVEALITASHLDPNTAPYWERGLPGRSRSSYEERGERRFPPGLTAGVSTPQLR